MFKFLFWGFQICRAMQSWSTDFKTQRFYKGLKIDQSSYKKLRFVKICSTLQKQSGQGVRGVPNHGNAPLNCSINSHYNFKNCRIKLHHKTVLWNCRVNLSYSFIAQSYPSSGQHFKKSETCEKRGASPSGLVLKILLQNSGIKL